LVCKIYIGEVNVAASFCTCTKQNISVSNIVMQHTHLVASADISPTRLPCKAAVLKKAYF